MYSASVFAGAFPGISPGCCVSNIKARGSGNHYFYNKGSLIMGNISSVLAPLRKLSWIMRQKSVDNHGRPFVDMIRDHPLYGPSISEQINYEIKHQSTPGHHWRLLVRKLGYPFLPYISIEISTSTMKNLIEVMIKFWPRDCENATYLGLYHGSFFELCEHADAVVKEMKEYDLFNSNCQTFCNGVLRRIGKDELLTTDEKVFSGLLQDILPSAANAPTREVELEAELEAQFELDNITRKPSANDLNALVEILATVECRWEEIGKKLLGESALRIIKYTYPQPHCCLRQMLKAYLHVSQANLLSWKHLVDAVKEHNMDVARAVAKLANTVQQQQAETTEETSVL